MWEPCFVRCGPHITDEGGLWPVLRSMEWRTGHRAAAQNSVDDCWRRGWGLGGASGAARFCRSHHANCQLRQVR